jgi:hypothetical protein
MTKAKYGWGCGLCGRACLPRKCVALSSKVKILILPKVKRVKRVKERERKRELK